MHNTFNQFATSIQYSNGAIVIWIFLVTVLMNRGNGAWLLPLLRADMYEHLMLNWNQAISKSSLNRLGQRYGSPTYQNIPSPYDKRQERQ